MLNSLLLLFCTRDPAGLRCKCMVDLSLSLMVVGKGLGSWRIPRVCGGWGLGRDGCKDFQLFGFREARLLRKSPDATLVGTRCFRLLQFSLSSLFFHTSVYVCAFACAHMWMRMPEVSPWYLSSECRQPCSLSQSFSILPGTDELGWAGWPVSTGPPFFISSFSALGLCTITSSLFLGGFWDHSQVFLLAKQTLY